MSLLPSYPGSSSLSPLLTTLFFPLIYPSSPSPSYSSSYSSTCFPPPRLTNPTSLATTNISLQLLNSHYTRCTHRPLRDQPITSLNPAAGSGFFLPLQPPTTPVKLLLPSLSLLPSQRLVQWFQALLLLLRLRLRFFAFSPLAAVHTQVINV